MQTNSSPRKAIHDIISNIRQIASNISKDVGADPQFTFPSQPIQDQYRLQGRLSSSNRQDAIEIRPAISSRGTVEAEENEAGIQNSCDIAQGIKNAHSKVDQALRFMNDMKNKLAPDAKNQPLVEKKYRSVNALVDRTKEDIAHKTQTGYPKSLPILSQTQQTPSVSTLPMTLDDLKGSPKSAVSTYLDNQGASPFNPFSKPVSNKSPEFVSSVEQKILPSNITTRHYPTPVPGAVSSLNTPYTQNTNQTAQTLYGFPQKKLPNATLNPTFAVDSQRRLISAGSTSRPSSANPANLLQPGCDHNRLNQIVNNIKYKGVGLTAQYMHQPLSLNEMQLGNVHSLTSLHDQAAEFEMIRPNTVSYLTRPPMSTNGFMFPRENNFYQLPQERYEVVPSHLSSQYSAYERNQVLRHNSTTSGFLAAVQKATNQASEGESDNVYVEEEEAFKPRRLRFEQERVHPQVVQPQKKISQRKKSVKMSQPEIMDQQRKIDRKPSYPHKAHKVRDIQGASDKQRYVVDEDDSEIEEPVVAYQVRSRKNRRAPACNHESCASSQSEEESMEESVHYELPRNVKTYTQRAVDSKASTCHHCHCKKAPKEYVVYSTQTSSGRVSRSHQRSHSRRQKSPTEDHKVAFEPSIDTYDTDTYESKSQTLNRKKSAERLKEPARRKTILAQRAVNSENVATTTRDIPKSRKSSKQEKISLESLRKKDENQEDLKGYQDYKMTSKFLTGTPEVQASLYNKVFVDQLALQFPNKNENKTRDDSVSKNKGVQKTEVMRSGSKMAKRIVF